MCQCQALNLIIYSNIDKIKTKVIRLLSGLTTIDKISIIIYNKYQII